MQDKLSLLVPEATYHIYKRANGNEKIFLTGENYRFFIKKFQFHLAPISEVFCYCLMPNHFHFLVRIKSESEIESVLGQEKCLKYGHGKLVSKQFSNFFSSYTQAFNKFYNRRGSLFMKNFKRKRVSDDAYFFNLIHYIHTNPLKAGLTDSLMNYSYSSYCSIVQEVSDFILRKELISRFGDLEKFIRFHQKREELSENEVLGELE